MGERGYVVHEGCDHVFFVGFLGAGKSTLASLICGFLKPDRGTIRLDGNDISSLSVKERGEKIGYVMQSPNQMISKPMIMEEVGLEVDNVRYYKSQPWGIASDILSGFFCDVVGAKEIKMDASELKYAQWVAPEDIDLQTPGYSLTNEMMKLFKEQGYEGTKMQ